MPALKKGARRIETEVKTGYGWVPDLPDHRSRVGVDRMLDHALVVVDEQPAHVHKRDLVLQLQKLDSPGKRVTGAAPQLSLVLHG